MLGLAVSSCHDLEAGSSSMEILGSRLTSAGHALVEKPHRPPGEAALCP